MIESIHVEPAHEQRPAFAAWGLSQTPPLQTATASGWDVPVDLYAAMPTELLAGAYVDGYPYDVAQAQPVQLPFEPDPVHIDPAPLAAEGRPAPKKRAPRKRTAKKPTVSLDDTDAVIVDLSDQASSEGASSGD